MLVMQRELPASIASMLASRHLEELVMVAGGEKKTRTMSGTLAVARR